MPKKITRRRHVKLSERDSLMVMALLKKPPKPNTKLRKAARELLSRARYKPE